MLKSTKDSESIFSKSWPTTAAPKQIIAELEHQLSLERKRRQRLEESVNRITEQLWAERMRRQRLERLIAVKEGREAELLSLKRAGDYLRLLWWLLVRPEMFKGYQASLSDREATRLCWQSTLLASILIWCPLFLWIALSWAFGILNFTPHVGIPLLGGIAVAWVVTGLLGSFDNALAAFTAVFIAAVIILPVVAIVAGVTDFEPTNVELMIWGGVINLVSTMLSQAVSAMTQATVNDIVAGAVAVVLGGGVIIMLPGSTVNAFNVILVAVAAILLSGLAQARFKEIQP